MFGSQYCVLLCSPSYSQVAAKLLSGFVSSATFGFFLFPFNYGNFCVSRRISVVVSCVYVFTLLLPGSTKTWKKKTGKSRIFSNCGSVISACFGLRSRNDKKGRKANRDGLRNMRTCTDHLFLLCPLSACWCLVVSLVSLFVYSLAMGQVTRVKSCHWSACSCLVLSLASLLVFNIVIGQLTRVWCCH